MTSDVDYLVLRERWLKDAENHRRLGLSQLSWDVSPEELAEVDAALGTMTPEQRKAFHFAVSAAYDQGADDNY